MLSPKVQESLEEAQGSLRNALYHASKNEKPMINKQIAEIMLAIDYLMKMEEMSDKLESYMKQQGNSFFGGMF